MANSRTKDSLQRLDLNSWKDGEVSSFYAARVPDSGLKVAQDMLVEQNGTAGDRGSFLRDTIDVLPYPLLGNVYVYKLADNSENIICMLNNGTNGIVYTLDDDGIHWVDHDEISYDKTKQVCFVQSTDKIVIFNGHDAFSFYDITESKVTQFAEVTNPVTKLTLAKTGLSTTGYTIYYRFTYVGNGGETALSPVESATIGKLRDNWAATDYFTITRPAVVDADAIEWNLFMSLVPDGSGVPIWSEYELIKESIPIATTVIVDNGKLVAETVRKAPETNTTAGIIASYGTNINGRIWALQDHTVYYGGDVGYELTFSGIDTRGAKGSGSRTIDQYGKETPKAIQLGRDNSGTSCINLLTAGVAGQGSIYDIYFTIVNVGSESIGDWEFKQREGNDGTNAPFSVIHANNNIYYLSLEGFKSTGVKPNITGIQATDIISNAIRDKVQLLTQSDLNNCYATYWDEKILWTVSYGSDTNNQIWVYDILHGGIWSRWNINADAIFRWAKTDSSSAKLYVVKDKKVLYYQPNSIAHQDDSNTFNTIIESGNISFKPDSREWVYMLQVLFILLRPMGKVHFSITAHTKKGNLTKDRLVDFGGISTGIGWNAISPELPLIGSHGSKIHNAVYGELTLKTPKEWQEVSLRFRKMAHYFSWKIWIEDKNSTMMLSQVIPEFTDIGMGPDMLTRTDTVRV